MFLGNAVEVANEKLRVLELGLTRKLTSPDDVRDLIERQVRQCLDRHDLRGARSILVHGSNLLEALMSDPDPVGVPGLEPGTSAV